MTFLLALMLQAFVPFNIPILPTNNATVSCSLNAANTKCANGFWLHHDTNIQYVLSQIGTVTTGDTIRVSLQYADSASIPDGTPLASVSLTVTAGMANSWQEISFSPPISVTGTPRLVYVVWDYDNYSGGNLQIVVGGSAPGFRNVRAAYNGTAWSFGNSPTALLKTSSGSIVGFGFLGWMRSGTGISSTSNPDEGGIACTFNRPLRLVGLARQVFSVTGNHDLGEFRVYRNNSVLWSAQSGTVDSVGSTFLWLPVAVTQRIILSPNVEYIFAFRATSTTATSVLFSNPQYPSSYNEWFSAHTGGLCRIATRVDDGAWQYNTGNPLFYVVPLLQEVQ